MMGKPILPLPKGEGRGEGERDILKPEPSAFSKRDHAFIKKPISKKKEPGKSSLCPACRRLSQKQFGTQSYLLVDGGVAGGGVGAAGCAFVLAGGAVSSLLHPVTSAPITRPISTIRVYILFIVSVPFTKSQKHTSTFFNLVSSCLDIANRLITYQFRCDFSRLNY